MHFLENFYFRNLKYELINKFLYNSTNKLPKLKKIILNFGCRTNDIKSLSSSLLALELISNQNSSITTTKRSNILLKIRKGNPTGCKVTLRKNKMSNCFSKILIEIAPKLKNFEGFTFNRKIKKNSFSYELHDTFNFQELEEHYYLFNNLPKLNITLVTNTETKKELLFLLNSLKFPLKKKKQI